MDKRWIRCMSSKGHSGANHMWSVINDLVLEKVDVGLEPDSVDLELKIAFDDVTCHGDTLGELQRIRISVEADGSF